MFVTTYVLRIFLSQHRSYLTRFSINYVLTKSIHIKGIRIFIYLFSCIYVPVHLHLSVFSTPHIHRRRPTGLRVHKVTCKLATYTGVYAYARVHTRARGSRNRVSFTSFFFFLFLFACFSFALFPAFFCLFYTFIDNRLLRDQIFF